MKHYRIKDKSLSYYVKWFYYQEINPDFLSLVLKFTIAAIYLNRQKNWKIFYKIARILIYNISLQNDG